ASESELVKLAKKLSSIRIVRISHETPNSGKRQRKNKQRADFVDEEDRSSEEETAESPRKKRKNIKSTSKNKVSTKTPKEKETKESKEAKEKKEQFKPKNRHHKTRQRCYLVILSMYEHQNRRSPHNQDDRSPPKHSDRTPLNQYDKAHPDQQDSSLSNQHSRFLLSQHNRYSSNQHDSRSPTRQHDRPPPNPCDSRSPTYQQDSPPPNQHNCYPSNQHYSRSPTHLNDSPPPSQYNNYPHNQHDGSFSNQHHRCPTNQLIATNDRSVNQHDKSPPLEEYSRPLSGQHYISYPDQCYNYAPDHQFSSLNEHINTSPSFLTLLGNSDVCAECLLKDKQLKSMQEKLQKTEMDYHHIKIKYQELKASKALYSCTSISHTPRHYVPVRGVQIPAAPHEFVALGTDPPLGFERLGSTNLCVQSLWLSTVTSKCRNDSPSLFMKKMIDGFFLPEQLS
uniref:GATA zinc finger domain-containing protein 14-like n=1 Tax=Saccoglossus kowalevskii TaxID=10224 RepID=A0ABM0LW61_SACKO